jgi:hypothetical protein
VLQDQLELKKLAAAMTGLSEASLEAVLAHLKAEDTSNLATLRSRFAALDPLAVANNLRAFISMANGAMSVPVAEAVEGVPKQVTPEAAMQGSASGLRRTRRKLSVMPAAQKRVQPELWKRGSVFVGDEGGDFTVRVEKMAAKVEDQHGWPVDDGRGRGIWCGACKKLQPLHQPFDLFAWKTHVASKAHLAAVRALDEGQLQMCNWGVYA